MSCALTGSLLALVPRPSPPPAPSSILPLPPLFPHWYRMPLTIQATKDGRMLLDLAKETVEALHREKQGETCSQRIARERKSAPPVRDCVSMAL